MKIEDQRNQRYGQHQAGDDPPAQFEPYRKERDLAAQALSLHVAAIEVIGKDRQEGTQKQLKHGSLPRSWRRRRSPYPALPGQLRERRFRRPSLAYRRRAERLPFFPPIRRSGAVACRNRANRSLPATARPPRRYGCA